MCFVLLTYCSFICVVENLYSVCFVLLTHCCFICVVVTRANHTFPVSRPRPRRSVITEVTAQLLVVVDREMIDFHGNESVEEYVLSIMNMVRNVRNSLGIHLLSCL